MARAQLRTTVGSLRQFFCGTIVAARDLGCSLSSRVACALNAASSLASCKPSRSKHQARHTTPRNSQTDPAQTKMILTNCAACAAPLAHNAPRCVRCWTRYCDSTCQHDHWRRGHKQMCKKIHRGGNAEQYHADKKYKEAVAVATRRGDTKGQTCYICTQALHWKTKEGLVRGCACRGTSGFAHVSCLAEQAKILPPEAEENNLGADAKNKRWDRWTRAAYASKSTTASCGARSGGLLEDVRGPAGGGPGSPQ